MNPNDRDRSDGVQPDRESPAPDHAEDRHDDEPHGADRPGDDRRPEEVLASLWAQILAKRERGEEPSRVVMNMATYRRIQRYHAYLGTLPNAELDYIAKYEIFGLPIYIDDHADPAVR